MSVAARNESSPGKANGRTRGTWSIRVKHPGCASLTRATLAVFVTAGREHTMSTAVRDERRPGKAKGRTPGHVEFQCEVPRVRVAYPVKRPRFFESVASRG